MSKAYVYIELFGGLGNQLFQYCAAYITANHLQTPFFIRSATDNYHNINSLNYAKTLFTDAIECEEPPVYTVTYSQAQPPFSSWHPQGMVAPCRLSGYFQYYPTLEPSLPELVQKFRRALGVQHQTNTVMMHVRRGDYVEKPHIHYLQGAEYYYAAYKHLNRILQALPPKVLVFSDDIPWCKDQSWIRAIPNVDFYENSNEIETLAEMARCGGGAIIANSTFSWWGALLSQTPYVYYPSKWIAMPVECLFPSQWVCIDG
jgi:hypothetical protein